MKAIAKFFVVALLLGSSATATFAGPFGGPRWDVARCPAHSNNNYTVTFNGGQLATVTVVGDGDTDLDLYVYDMNGTLVASGTGLSDRESVAFVPAFTSTYRIQVRNLGNVWNQYRIDMR